MLTTHAAKAIKYNIDDIQLNIYSAPFVMVKLVINFLGSSLFGVREFLSGVRVFLASQHDGRSWY